MQNSSHEQLLDLVDFQDFLMTNAERKSYGIRDKLSLIYDDESNDALWSWELINFKIFSAE